MRIKNPPNQQRNTNSLLSGVSGRLLVLVAMFFLDMWMMFEARKPENWEWMGFERLDDQTNTSVEGKAEGSAEGTSQDERQNPNQDGFGANGSGQFQPDVQLVNPTKSRKTKSNGFKGDAKVDGAGQGDKQDGDKQDGDKQDGDKQEVGDGRDDPNGDFQVQLANLQRSVDAVERDFWRQAFHRLNLEQQKDFFFALRFARGVTSADEEQTTRYESLLKRMDNWSTTYQSKILEHVGSLPDDRLQEKKQWNETLFQFQNRWNDKFKRALFNRFVGDSPDRNDLGTLTLIQEHLRQFSNSGIRDRAPISRAREGIAWMLAWEKILAQKEMRSEIEDEEIALDDSIANLPVASQVQLSSQPQAFRGKMVRIQGRVRAAEKQLFSNHPLGISHFYILWIRSFESPTIPICVYCIELPEGFPEVSEVRTELDEDFEATGMFYKVRSYPTNDGWKYCPTVLANSFTSAKKSLTKQQATTLPGWPVIVTVLLGMIWIAILIARLAYRSVWIHRRANPEAERKISDDVSQLVDNPLIETVDQRLARLADQHRGQSIENSFPDPEAGSDR